MSVKLANPTAIVTLTAPTLKARITAFAKLDLSGMGQLAQVGKIVVCLFVFFCLLLLLLLFFFCFSSFFFLFDLFILFFSFLVLFCFFFCCNCQNSCIFTATTIRSRFGSRKSKKKTGITYSSFSFIGTAMRI